MKRRDYKNNAVGEIYHIFNRGNNREDVFLDNQDCRIFLRRLGLVLKIKKEVLDESEMTTSPKSRTQIKSFPENSFKIHAFCLMKNHFHLLIEQCSEIPISKFMHKVCTSYSMYMNKKYRRVGHVFQDRFKSVIIESNDQLMWVSNYIHSNPIKDRLVEKLINYKWSSYADYVNQRNNPILTKDFLITVFNSTENFIKQNNLFTKNMPRRVLSIKYYTIPLNKNSNACELSRTVLAKYKHEKI
ncbi:MAG: transposase [Patescibacteria group bacterium]